MKIRLNVYSPGVHEIHESVTVGELELDSTLFRAVDARLSLHRHDPYFDFVFRLRAEVELECDRCLEMYHDQVVAEAPMIYVVGRTLGGAEVDDPNYAELPANTIDLDLTADLRDQFILALPEKRLCDLDCQGLCPHCGVNLNREACKCKA